MPADQNVTATGVYYDQQGGCWIYHEGDKVVGRSLQMAEDDAVAAEKWFIQVGWLRPLHCWKIGPVTCDSMIFKYINAIPGAGYWIEGKSRLWYWWQDRKAEWNALARKFCRDTCPNK